MGGWQLDSYSSGEGPVAGPCEYGNKLLGSIKTWISQLAQKLLVSQGGFCSMELWYDAHEWYTQLCKQKGKQMQEGMSSGSLLYYRRISKFLIYQFKYNCWCV